MRRIRSFVRREGRMTPSQSRALDAAWPHCGLTLAQGPVDLRALFPGRQRIVLEIGFGMGDSLLDLATTQPDTGFIGIEVHRPGVGRLLGAVETAGLDNVRVYAEDAVEVLAQCIPADSLDALLLYFPDPWPKKRHHKRRIVQPDFVALVRSRLRAGGVFHLATDWQDYAEHMMAVLGEAPGWRNCHGAGVYVPPPAPRPPTKFERRGQQLGHGVWDLHFERVD